MRVLPRERDMIYGPLFSRRLGRSLGVNLLPAGHKLCSFDCVYCHYGSTDVKILSLKKGNFPSVRRVQGKPLHQKPNSKARVATL